MSSSSFGGSFRDSASASRVSLVALLRRMFEENSNFAVLARIKDFRFQLVPAEIEAFFNRRVLAGIEEFAACYVSQYTTFSTCRNGNTVVLYIIKKCRYYIKSKIVTQIQNCRNSVIVFQSSIILT